MRSFDADVAVVGFGPVGATLAILLGQLGRSVAVVERWPEPYPLPRAVHFDHEVGRILGSCGIAQELRQITEPTESYEWRNADGTTLLRFGRTGQSPSGWPLSSMFNQPAFEALLDRRAKALPRIELRRGVEVTGLDQDDDGVTLLTAHDDQVRARYAVGCDGANSSIRDLVGLSVVDLGFFYDWLVVDVLLDEARVFDPPNLQICDPARPTTVVSGGPGRRRWEFMRLPNESFEELSDERAAWTLLAPFDVRPDNARLERHAVYTFRARYAKQWRAERVFLAGDAAHVMPPFAGQGMCAGIRDAANLAWKLDLVLTGRACATSLDTYEAERLPSVRAAIDFSIELGNVICVPDSVEAAARDEAMAAALGPDPMEPPNPPGLDDGLIHPRAPLAGQPFIQPSVGGRLFDEIYGPGWRLVTLGPGTSDLEPELLEWFASIGGRAIHLHQPEKIAARWFAEHQCVAALQRPDFYLYGTATNPGETSDLLVDLRSQLTPIDRSPQGVHP